MQLWRCLLRGVAFHGHVFLHRAIGLLAVTEVFVVAHNAVAVANLAYLAFVEPNCDVAQLLHVEHRVAAEHHGFLLRTEFIHALHALFLKGEIPHRQRFVDNQNIWPHHGRNGEREAHIHTRRISLHGSVDELAKL